MQQLNKEYLINPESTYESLFHKQHNTPNEEGFILTDQEVVRTDYYNQEGSFTEEEITQDNLIGELTLMEPLNSTPNYIDEENYILGICEEDPTKIGTFIHDYHYTFLYKFINLKTNNIILYGYLIDGDDLSVHKEGVSNYANDPRLIDVQIDYIVQNTIGDVSHYINKRLQEGTNQVIYWNNIVSAKIPSDLIILNNIDFDKLKDLSPWGIIENLRTEINGSETFFKYQQITDGVIEPIKF